MNSDIRIITTFPHHHKTKKLRRRLGAEGICALVFLWIFAAENRPDGVLSGMDDDDICIACQWDGDARSMLGALLDIGFLELVEDTYVIHDWKENNPWAAGAPDRQAKAKKASAARWGNKNAPSMGLDASSINIDAPSIASPDNEQCSKMLPADSSNAPFLSFPILTNTNTNTNTKPKNKAASDDAFVLPAWVPLDEWNAYVEMRNKIKEPMTSRAVVLAVNTLDRLRSAGNDPGAVLDASVLNNWKGLFELKDKGGGKNGIKNNETERERILRAIGQAPVDIQLQDACRDDFCLVQ